MSDDSNSPAAPDESAKKAVALLGARPPLPPEPQDASWTWTPEKLKAVYLEAFTDIAKSQIAQMVGIDSKTLYRWRTQGDYKRYMAELVYSDGVAEKVERNKTRKDVANKLLKAIIEKLERPGGLAGEKVSAMIKTFNDLLVSIGEDVASWEKVTEQARAGKPVQKEGSDMAAYIRAIDDPEERETVRRHMLAMFKAQIGEAPGLEPERREVIEADAVSSHMSEPTPQPAVSAEDAPGLSPDDLE